MKLAIIGKRNAGKSTLVNTLAGEKRVIVSEFDNRDEPECSGPSHRYIPHVFTRARSRPEE
jgi:GTPase SAR1 family protein